MTLLRLAVSAGLLSLLATAPVGAVAIDDFSTPQAEVSGTSQVLGGMLGGERDAIANGGGSIAVAGGMATLAGGSGGFIYDGIDGSSSATFGLGGIDLTGGGAADRFLIDVTDLSGIVSLSIQVFESSGNALVGTTSVSGLGTFEILFSDLSVGGTGADITAINQINLGFISVGAEESVVFDNFRTGGPEVSDVPEPGTWLLMAGGLGLLAFRRRS